jgi:DNA-directed RNA polymerase sigma subunit (sigma70/sigma32)
MPKSRTVPFTSRQVQPGAHEAVERAKAASEAMRAAEVTRKEQAVIRAEAIREAMALGLALAAIGEEMGVTRGRVQQYLKAK